MNQKALEMFLTFVRHDLHSILANLYDRVCLLEDSEDMSEKEKKQMFLDTKESIKWIMKFHSSAKEILIENPKMTAVHMDDCIKKAIAYNAETASKKSISINFEKSGTLGKGNEFMVESIVRNLIANAVKFTPTGGTIDVRIETRGGTLFVSVTDSGEGIPEELTDEEKLFAPSYNKVREGTNGEKGSGFGLFLCKDFVEKMGGEIHVARLEPNGTEFSFTVPNL